MFSLMTSRSGDNMLWYDWRCEVCGEEVNCPEPAPTCAEYNTVTTLEKRWFGLRTVKQDRIIVTNDHGLMMLVNDKPRKARSSRRRGHLGLVE